MSVQDLFFVVNSGGGPAEPEGATTVPVTDLTALATPAMDDLASSEYLTVLATNGGDDTLEGIGMWIDVATFPGDDSIRPNNSPETDLLDLIKMGDDAIDAGGPLTVEHTDNLTGLDMSGLWIVATSGPTWYRVCSLRGISPATRIGNMTVASLNYVGWALVINAPAGAPANRYYFDINVEATES